MAYQVEFDKRAQKDLRKLNPQVATAIVDKCSILEESPLQGPGIKRLKHNVYRLVVLYDWRVVYVVEGTKATIILVDHRKNIYRRLRQRI